MQDVVITGIGIACPLGVGRAAVWSAIENGQSGVSSLAHLVEAGYEVPMGGIVRDFEPKQYVKPRKSLKVMCRETQLGFAAAELAWEEAALDDANLDPERVGVVLATTVFRSELEDMYGTYQKVSTDGQFSFENWDEGMRELYPLWMLKYLPNMTACHIGIAHDCRGPLNTIVERDVSSVTAIIEAADAIRRGHADVMLTGGAGSLLPMVDLCWQRGWGMSRRTDDPASACRPFDAERDGCVPAEASAVFVLESRQHAETRGVKVQGSLLGYGRRCEPTAETREPTGQAIAQSIEAALEMSHVPPSEIGHVNAHGLAMQSSDRIEAQAIARTLPNVPVTAFKGYTGNSSAASGAVELALSLMGLAKNVIPPTLNHEKPDPACPVEVITGPQIAGSPAFMKLNHNLMGQAVALVVSGE